MTPFKKSLVKIAVCLSFMLCFATFAQAHKVNVFAALDGNMIVGKVYFSGGGLAEDVDVEVASQDGLKLATVKTSSKGEFIFVPKMKDTQYIFTVDTGDGHAARTTVAVGSVTLQAGAVKPPRPPSLAQLKVAPGTAAQAIQQQAMAQQPIAIDPEIIAEVVSVELSKQLRPLTERIDRYESGVRMGNVIGGIGFILGIAGVAAFLLARRQAGQGRDSKDKGK